MTPDGPDLTHPHDERTATPADPGHASDRSASDGSTSGGSVPDRSAPDRSAPGGSAPGPLTGWRVLVPRPPLDPTPAGAGSTAHGATGSLSHQVARERSSTTPTPPSPARAQSSTSTGPAHGAGSTAHGVDAGVSGVGSTAHQGVSRRSGPGLSPAAVALLAAGAEPLVVPLVRTVPVDDLAPLDDALLALGAGWYPWLTVTSQAAVAVLAERASAHDDGLAAVVERGGARVGAVGPGTARALEALGVRVDVVPPVRSTAVDLVAALVAATPGRTPRALFPRGDLAAPTLADGLTSAGWAVDDLVVYRTVPAGPPDPQVADAWRAGDVHAALLTSASSVRALLDHLGPPPQATRVVVIGPSTAAEARRLGLRVDAVAQRQTLAGLVDALVAHVDATGARPGTPPDAAVPASGRPGPATPAPATPTPAAPAPPSTPSAPSTPPTPVEDTP